MSNSEKDKFLNPIASYRGKFTPQNAAFDANLQEFTNRISLICGLETGGKISPVEAYQQIKELWNQLELSRHNLLDDE
ncbi:MAG: hypothetical protein NW214_03700 [Pseudanabaenaceae cyanobacterium bins.39]|nr:hypothetical protein [Pseudanabaenaceae cyanobacterium bins.39]